MIQSVLVVTGAGGMGVASARRMGSGRLVILADYSDKALEVGVAQLKSEGFTVESHKLNVADYDSVKKLAEHAAAAGRVDAIVHTAGVSPASSTKHLIFDINLVGTANVIDAFLPIVTVGSSVVCIASSAGHGYKYSDSLEQHLATAERTKLLQHPEVTSDTELSAYSLAKRGNILRVQTASREYGKKGARINSISPGVIYTPMSISELEGPSGDYIRDIIAAGAINRLGTSQEIAAAAAFLCSADASFITGIDLLVDGGLVAGRRWVFPGGT
ncbi:uncharacterized protein PV07_11289 [Cladophialophora immunda]|uniref:Uncharacterized protein n=1 Tax=Cladophialophora immunda TaxID=569365 RepID=A0A0D2ADU3_9EURO|nr:uncharacterized protein PV07_11289 [Cladophialophora immunda]KIW23057.1 hypothetical protein PV07_11289 [Cladophialophora immunda]OQU93631.1 hypothetical protein CLAIMM_00113 [Cladophialophora immunda]